MIMHIVAFLIGVLIGLVILLMVTPFKRISAGTAGFVTSFGRVTGRVLKTGINFVPFWQKVIVLKDGNRMFDKNIEAYTKEAFIVDVNSTFIFLMNPQDSLRLVKSNGKGAQEFLDKYLSIKMAGILLGVVSQYSVKDIVSNQNVIRSKVFELAEPIFDRFGQLLSIELDFVLPEEYTRSVRSEFISMLTSEFVSKLSNESPNKD